MKKIRVGLVGVAPDRGFTAQAHIPALQGLADFEIAAVCTTRQESAEAAARHYKVPLAFADAARMAAHPDVDLVTVCVNVPDHYVPVMAAIEAGKHVYCEWPLGRNSDEAARMRDAAQRGGVSHVVGLQGRSSPAINYVRDLIADGYLGRVRAATMLVNVPSWASHLSRPIIADIANGYNMVAIQGGHNLDILCYCLGDFAQLSAFAEIQRPEMRVASTNTVVRNTVPDQMTISGIVGDGVVASFQLRGGMTRGHHFLFEIHGDEGDIAVTATIDDISTQRQELEVRGARGAGKPLEEMPVPGKYRWVPENISRASPYNVAQHYQAWAKSMREGKPFATDFNVALSRHRLLETILDAAETGRRAIL